MGSLIHSDLDRYVKINCLLKAGMEESTEVLLANLYSSGFDAFEELQEGIVGYCNEEDLDQDLLEDHIINNPQYTGKWEFNKEIIESENWNLEWEKNFPPVNISSECRIKAEFHDPEPGFRYEITINPKMAFGTGHHETTALMMKEILNISVEGKKILDVGCGTAILGILCSMKGAADIIGLDNDPQAIESARENIQLNGTDKIRLLAGEISHLSESDFDLILANINLNYIISHLPAFAKLIKPGGKIICSGFFNTDYPRLKKAIANDGLIHDHSKHDNKWMVCVFDKIK